MSNESDGAMWPPAMFTQGLQEASERTLDRQQEFLRRLLDGNATGFPSQLEAMSQTATFKTRVQSAGRISIPDAEREALDIEEGDIVQTVIVPVKRTRGDTNE
ncbi:AbrB/MazE/SpoVT family DNA-binding domain-containing protein [Halomarina pelagica]|uniref:AbrB/MazE/SpoVT family DNA-binding domain-containing protein n=1 Tax=Halomarina pelagica TaxID=2961599 RepID=UPI0020C2C827|nr:AbrB/MazE/SpoVT family DNA-binding domain-containing protein [Halomarina sp. BND7]